MATLTRAHDELFRRNPDERFETMDDLARFCRAQKERSQDRWHSPKSLILDNMLRLCAGTDGSFLMNDWSFSQVCKMAGVGKDTINRLTPATAAQVFQETLPRGGTKPIQILTDDETVRSIHGTQYTRLWNIHLVNVLREFAVDFTPPQKGFNGATGLYAGEQDLFCFLIDPKGWVEINGEGFAPGLFVWNSEVGRRSLGIQTFWFQAVCANHIVWDAVEVVDWSRKHTAKVDEGLNEIRRIIERLVQKRDARKDGFATMIRKAMEQTVDGDAEKVQQLLAKNGIGREATKKAMEMAGPQGRFTIWTLVDALTRVAGETRNAGDRTEADQRAAGLLALV